MVHDFIVIGGGIAGTSAAARLSGLGSVLVLEAEEALAYHASGRSAALYEQTYGHPATVALNRASRPDHETLDGGVLSPRGLILLGGPGQEALAEADIRDMELTPLPVAEAVARVPILDPSHITRAAWHEDALDIDTDRLVQHFARTVRGAGGTVLTGARVEAIAREGGRWRVTCGDTPHEGRVLVNAAGAWADRIAAMAGIAPLGLTPLRRSVARMPAPGGHDVSGWPTLLGAGESWYAKPDAGAWLVSPAEEDPVPEPHDAFSDDMVLAEGIARYQPFVTEEVTRVTGSWAGLRTFAPDRCLVLGPEPGREDFVWVAGQGGYGFQTAPAASRLVADLVAGRRPELPPGIVAALRPDRLRTGGISAG
ncbi:FAD-dependent oxidoreductase [Roseibacterium sp. SDUM158017]|uniref:NAD(P)/FAD-dependent oxidoreductase n=1 Tax=Roseicyclus salinarum TaxID=3036773 RepID=UPI00241589C1|nr:FAD-dependent oxidoreductase [Roseibacterium sp. SDUM158017]MDG4647242.1 FAD-dependent oxidoreductase [Roseibacterium sp. SDUM158017]